MSTLTLLDAWVNMDCPQYSGMFQLKMGQFIPPFGIQRPASPYKLFTDYSQIVGYLFGASDPLYPTWGNLRDQGLMLHGTVKFGEGEGFQPNMYYGMGLFRGEAANTAANSDPAWTLFMTAKVKPIEGVMFGLSYEDGTRQYTTGGVNRTLNRDRFGFCTEVKMHGFHMCAEYIVGDNSPIGDLDKHNDHTNTADPRYRFVHNNRQDVDGWYLELGYMAMPNKLKVISKIDILDVPAYSMNWTSGSDTRSGEHDITYRKKRKYGLGLVWFITKHCKVKFLWQQTQNEGRGKLHKIAGSEHSGLVCFGVNF
jgi:hypothetical protein